MTRFDTLKLPLAAALLCAATMTGAARPATGVVPVVERRGEAVAAPAHSDASDGRALGSVDGPKRDSQRPDWLMLLAGLAIAGWIAQRRLGSSLE